MADKVRTKTIRKGAQALKSEARELTHQAVSNPAVDRFVHLLRERPVTSMAIAAGLIFLGTLLASRHRHAEN